MTFAPVARREKPAVRAQEIMDAAVKLAEVQGYRTVSRGQIADAAECAASLISHYFGDVPALRQAIMREAIEIENIEIILQGLVVKDGLALGAPKPLRVRAFNLLDQQV